MGILGLTTTSTYTSAHPKITQHFDFGDYETALRTYVPQVELAGADVVIVLAHVTPNELVTLASLVSDLNIPIFLGGHGGLQTVTHVGSSLIAMAGHYSSQYVKINLTIDRATKNVITASGELIENLECKYSSDTSIQDIVDYWDNLMGANEVISFTSRFLTDNSAEDSEIGILITDGFIFNTSYDFGIANRGGGFRDDFHKGNITIADIISVIPFENYLMEINLTGQELIDFVKANTHLVYSGIRYDFTTLSDFRLKRENRFFEINLTKMYSGVMLDYIWWVTYKDDFPDAIDTGVRYRDSVIAYFRTISDLSQPNVEIIIPQNMAVLSQSPVVFNYSIFSPLYPVSHVSISIDGRANTTVIPSGSMLEFLPGNHEIFVEAEDSKGNIGNNIVIFTVGIPNDKTTTTATTSTTSIVSSEPLTRVESSVSSGAFMTIPSSSAEVSYFLGISFIVLIIFSITFFSKERGNHRKK